MEIITEQQKGDYDLFLSISDLDFYCSSTQAIGLVRAKNNFKENFQNLLSQLVDKTKARGGGLAHNSLGSHKILTAGQFGGEVKMTENECRLLLMGKAFFKKGFYLHPIFNEERLAGIIYLKFNPQTWEPVYKELVQAYAHLVSQNFKIHRKQSQLSDYADSLHQKKRELERIQKYNQNLLSITTHDLSSPLNAVSGYLEMIDDCLQNKESANKLYHYCKRVQSGVEDVSDILNQLNEVVKLKKGFSSLNSVKADANWMIKDVCNLLKSRAKKKNINLQIETKDTPAYVKVDMVKFKRVIHNLVSNAIKYTPQNKSIDVQTYKKNEQIYVQVRDHGIGISQEDMETIFDPFTKLHSSTSQSSCGLGLYISSYFMKLMNGKIMVESKEGKGSTFTVAVPSTAAFTVQSKTA